MSKDLNKVIAEASKEAVLLAQSLVRSNKHVSNSTRLLALRKKQSFSSNRVGGSMDWIQP